VHRNLDGVEQAVRAIVEFDAMQGQRLGLEIERIRGQMTGTIMLLEASSVALAILAAFLAFRQARRAVGVLELDRTAGEQREAELASRAEALGEFAGRVAHDILSPLSTSMLGLEIARGACRMDPDAQRAATQGVAAIHRVHTLVDGLLAFSRAGGRPEPGVSTEIAPLIVELIDGLTLQARQQRIALELAAVPAGTVACSPGVLTSLISNLVRNAIRYMGDAPSRRIDVRVLDAGERWRFEVQDTGAGIPVEQQQLIFEPYVQLGRSDTGIGLGLATVDRLVRAHGGSLGVVSAPGRGALFWFELPKSIEMAEPATPVLAHAQARPEVRR
jgi:signal transduction histidine kinase